MADFGTNLESSGTPASMFDPYARAHDRFSPATAGSVTGAVAGPLMFLTADQSLVYLRGAAGSFFSALGTLCAGAYDVDPRIVALAISSIAGALIGAAFAILTQRLRRFVPLLFWSLVFFPTTWLLVHAYALALIDPHLRARIAFLPFLAGTVVFAFVVTLALPLRKAD